MIRKQAGFTMTELLITMAIFIFAITAVTNVFVPLVTQFKQQSRIAETQTEGIVGLEVLRRDLEQAGFGLPWVIPTGITYSEGSSSTSGSIPAPNTYNEATVSGTTDPPRAIVTGTDIAGLGGSDYLVIKATSVADNSAAMKWTQVIGAAGGGSTVRIWNSSTEDLSATDRVIAIIPSRGLSNRRVLVNNGTAFSTQFTASASSPTAFPSGFAPSTENDVHLIYGVDPSTDLRMPFNRADYFIENLTSTTIPARCAAGTGVLMKYVIDQATGNRGTGMPLLDCVAYFQVVFRLVDPTNENNLIVADDLSGLTAQQLREQLAEVRVYILAHEGQKDMNYTYPNSTLQITDMNDPAYSLGMMFNFTTSGITDWQHYRWKVYRIVVKPNNLGAF